MTKAMPFHDPVEYPSVSVATTGTHDTEPMIVWWEAAEPEERAAVAAVPTIQDVAAGADLLGAPFVPTVRDTLIEALFASASGVVLFPVQDVFGWRDRINEPATVSDGNWTYRLPWPVDQLDAQPESRERQAALRRWSVKYGRTTSVVMHGCRMHGWQGRGRHARVHPCTRAFCCSREFKDLQAAVRVQALPALRVPCRSDALHCISLIPRRAGQP